MNIQHLIPWVEKLAGKRVLVVGDVILDEYLVGRTSRLSREAPIPVLEFMERRLIPGGAANPGANIAALGGTALQVGVVGDDAHAAEVRAALQKRGIDTAGLVTDAGRPTTVKTRILAHQGLSFPQQVARLDRVDRTAINGAVADQVVAGLKRAGALDAVLLSDYLSGLLTPSVVARLQVEARGKRQETRGKRLETRESGLLLTADAQGELEKYSGFDVVKCNRKEAGLALGQDLHTDADLADGGGVLLERLNLRRAMIITRGADGVTAVERGGQITHLRQLPAAQAEVFDTVGAGDTVIAVLTLALAAGAPVPEAAMLANVAAGLVVRRVGNYTPTPDELRRALSTWQTAD